MSLAENQRKLILYLPKNNQFFKRKNFPHPPERTNFPLKEKIYYTYLKNSNFSIEKSSSTYLKEINFLPKEKFIVLPPKNNKSPTRKNVFIHVWKNFFYLPEKIPYFRRVLCWTQY